MTFRALLFDLDGTLVDSIPDVCASVNTALEEYGHSSITVDQAKTLVGHGARVLIEKAVGMGGGAANGQDLDGMLARFLDTYSRNPCQHSTLFPGAVDALDRLTGAGIALGICTNKPEATTFPVLDAFILGHYFKTVICGDTLAFRKPDPRHVFHVLDTMGADKSDAAFIGDSETDIKAAINAGLPSVCVTFGYCNVPLESLGADVLIDHFDNLEAALSKIAGGKESP